MRCNSSLYKEGWRDVSLKGKAKVFGVLWNCNLIGKHCITNLKLKYAYNAY